MCEARRKRMQAETCDEQDYADDRAILVGAIYRNASFSARIRVVDVPLVLQAMKSSLKGYKANRSAYLDAKDHVATALLKDEHLTEEGGYLMAHTLLWCFCVGSPMADLCREYCRQGGHALVYEITGEIPGRVNFRSILGPTASHPLTHLFPNQSTIETVGSA